MSGEAHISIFARQTKPDDLFCKFKEIQEKDSIFINVFINEGFNPVIDVERRCPRGMLEQDGIFIIEGEDWFREEDQIVPEDIEKIKCAIVFPTVKEKEDKRRVKECAIYHFSELLGFKQAYPDTKLKDYYTKTVFNFRPMDGTQKAHVQSVTGIGDKLPDGRHVIQICGGEYEKTVSERLANLTKFLINVK
jgi:hypothetical protein